MLGGRSRAGLRPDVRGVASGPAGLRATEAKPCFSLDGLLETSTMHTSFCVFVFVFFSLPPPPPCVAKLV